MSLAFRDSRIRHAPGECDACEWERRDREATQIQATTIGTESEETGETQRYASGFVPTVAVALNEEADGLSTG